MSAVIISCLRSTRSTIAPAKGPKRNAGAIRAIITTATEPSAAVCDPASRATSEVTATNPTQSPREETPMAAASREKAGWVSRSRSVADLVPRSAATSSA